MKRKCTPHFGPIRGSLDESGFLNLRACIAILLCPLAGCWVLSATLLAFFSPQASLQLSEKTLSFAERVTYQRAIEDVYWRHRIWPKEHRDPKPPLDSVMPQAQLERKSQITCANHMRWRITGNGRSPLSSYRQRWIGWQNTPNSPGCCAKSLELSATILS